MIDLSFDPSFTKWPSGSFHCLPNPRRITCDSTGVATFDQRPGEHPAWPGFTYDMCQMSGPITTKNGDSQTFTFDLSAPRTPQYGFCVLFEVHQQPMDPKIVQGSPMLQLDVAGIPRLIVRGGGNGGTAWSEQAEILLPEFRDSAFHTFDILLKDINGASSVTVAVDGKLVASKVAKIGFDNCTYYPKIGVYRQTGGNTSSLLVKARELHVTPFVDAPPPPPPVDPRKAQIDGIIDLLTKLKASL